MFISATPGGASARGLPSRICWAYLSCWHDPSVSFAKMLRVSPGLLQSFLSGLLALAGCSHSWVGAFRGPETPFPPPHPNGVLNCTFDLPGCSPSPLQVSYTSEACGLQNRPPEWGPWVFGADPQYVG